METGNVSELVDSEVVSGRFAAVRLPAQYRTSGKLPRRRGPRLTSDGTSRAGQDLPREADQRAYRERIAAPTSAHSAEVSPTYKIASKVLRTSSDVVASPFEPEQRNRR